MDRALAAKDISMSQLELEQELKSITHPSLFADVIRHRPLESIPMIKGQIKDNRLLCVEIIGENLVRLIEKMPS